MKPSYENKKEVHKMSGCLVSYIFLFFTVAITVVDAQHVSFRDTTVTLTCPDGEDFNWFYVRNDPKDLMVNESVLSLPNYTDKNDGLYFCTYKEFSESTEKKKHHFFIKAKVCDGCVDMNMMVAFGLVFSDVLITLGIVVMVYICAKKKAGSAAPQRATQARQQRGPTRGPPIPDPDYQVLNPATRSNDVYAQANRR